MNTEAIVWSSDPRPAPPRKRFIIEQTDRGWRVFWNITCKEMRYQDFPLGRAGFSRRPVDRSDLEVYVAEQAAKQFATSEYIGFFFELRSQAERAERAALDALAELKR